MVGHLNTTIGRRSSRFSSSDGSYGGSRASGDQSYAEITLDIPEDSVAVQVEDPESILLSKGLEKKSSLSRGSSALVRNASSRIKQVSHDLKQLASLSRQPPSVQVCGRSDRTKLVAANALEVLKFISKANGGAAWDAVEQQYNEIAVKSDDGLLHRSQFCTCIGMKAESEEFAGVLFDALCRRHCIEGDSINKAQLREFLKQLSDQSFDNRLQIFFDMVDKDADGRITEEEVKEIITVSASANRLVTIQQQADEYAALFMEALDRNNVGYIMIENLETLLLQATNQPTRGGDESRVLSQILKGSTGVGPLRGWSRDGRYFLMDNWQRVWVMVVWIGVIIGLFTWKYIEYRNSAAYQVMGHCVCMAKGAAETLKLNMAIILLPVCRNTITWLRNKTRLGVAVPFDDNIHFHQVIAVAIAIGVAIHGIYHLACDFPSLIHAHPDNYAPMFQFFGEQPSSYWHFVKSFEGISGIVMVVLMAIAFTLASPWFRRSRIKLPKPLKMLTGFNAFWYSHHLFVIVYALLIAHGIKLYLTHKWYKKTTWMYLAVPVLLYGCERLIRALRSSMKPVKILKVAIYPGNVLALQMSKPNGFKYKSGQYMFVKCSAVSPFEWHPFSITSAPGDSYLSVHIRAVGDWTSQLKTEFSEACQPPPNGQSGLLREDNCVPSFPKVSIDGPYGAPAQDYKKYEVVLLVGLGIGATPMISIVKDIVSNMKAMEEEEKALENGTPSGSPSDFKTRRAYFYWVTGEQGTFEWFKEIMNEVADLDNNEVIEMHNYCTSVYQEGDAQSALITMIQSINHAKNGVDVVSGTRIKSHFGRPNWRTVYKLIALKHPDSQVGVFYCGRQELAEELKQLALDFSHKIPTKFEFHKENF